MINLKLIERKRKMETIPLALITLFVANGIFSNEVLKTKGESTPIVESSTSSSNFSGSRITLGGNYIIHSEGSSLYFPISVNRGEIFDVQTDSGYSWKAQLSNGIGKFYVDISHTKVTESNFLYGASVFLGYDPNTIDKNSKWSLTNKDGVIENDAANRDLAAFLNADPKFSGNLVVGIKVNAGIVIMPIIAIKAIGELNLTTYSTNIYVTKDSTGSNLTGSTFGGALGIGVDVSITENFILGVGGKYNFTPDKITLSGAETNLPNTRVNIINPPTVTHSGTNFELFAEISYRF